ncbi:MAG: hypothetical protein KC643_19515 [Nitrospira sp.]|nr:hypothetical protein [Nitrospira sp.]
MKNIFTFAITAFMIFKSLVVPAEADTKDFNKRLSSVEKPIAELVVPAEADTKDFNKRLSSIEKQITENSKNLNDFLNRGGFDQKQIERQKELKDLQWNLEKTARNLAGEELSIGNTYLQIVGMMLVFAGLLSGAGVLLVKFYSEKRFNDIVSDAEKKLSDRISNLSIAFQTTFYLDLSFAAWEIYEPLIKKLKESDFDPQKYEFIHALTHMRIAKHFAEKGLQAVNEPTQDIFLLNDYIYHATMEMAFLNKFKTPIRIDQKDSHPIISRAEKCLEISRGREGKEVWFNLQESVAFTMVMIGNEGKKKEGEKLIENLLSDQTEVPNGEGFNPPPTSWKQKIWDKWKNDFSLPLTVDRPVSVT